MLRVLLVLLSISSMVMAQETANQTRHTAPRISGKALFQQHCASCHGEDAKGAGPAAVSFKIQPPDLTELSRQNGGKFPRDRVIRAIRGDRPPTAHGPTEMPVWGPVFLALTGVNPAQVDKRIRDLTEYIKSLQVK
jgi:mono/diheme cytochrome c family protein